MTDGEGGRRSPRRGRGGKKNWSKSPRGQKPPSGGVGVAAYEEVAPTETSALGAARQEVEPLEGEEGVQETTGGWEGEGQEEEIG